VDLIEFLGARLDEDEAVAREAEGLHWCTTKAYLGSVDVDDADRNRSVIMDREGGSMSEETGAHVARWDPARVLAEVEAKRRVIELLDVSQDPAMPAEAWILVTRIAEAMACAWADHPDSDPAWLTDVDTR
jgi:hypothetical protein